jgi:hypothetical protein
MDVGALVPLLVAPFAAWAAYLAGVRQDSRRWLRERRAELYVDVLVESYAEKQWALGVLAEREIADVEEDSERRREAVAEWREDYDRLIPDLRLSPTERARLAARMDAYGTGEVARLFGQIERGILFPLREGRYAQPFEVEAAFDAAQVQIRRELGNHDH